MDIRPVNPRDQTWEVAAPAYRVYFHETDGSSDEHELTGSDVGEVLAWADARSAGRSYVIHACVDRDGLGLVRLAGHDPNEM